MSKTTLIGRSSLALLLCLAGLLFATPRARADEGDQGDPPSRVARISYLDGSVSFQPGGEGDWGAAVKNRPVTIGDKLWVDKDSRAELQAGAATLHLGSMTALSFLNLDDATTQMRLAEGSINFRVRELREGDIYEVDTPNLAFTVKQAGAFRIDVSENGDGTRITVIRGEGTVTAGGKTYDLNPGERAEFNGTDDQIQYSTSAAPAPDGLDRWANDRDLKEDNSVSGKYVNRDTVGYSDLDDYGTWSEVPDYGSVWYPTVVDAGWAPYSNGYWGWVSPWGWTWIDYAPWGFAPFHYGRWAFVGGRWGWCPGPIFARPFYGPAFVGFFGGAHFGVGFGFGGGIGWFPLGWGEPFHPWFHCGPRFVERINVRNTFIRNTTIINNNHFNYAFAHNTRAVTVTSRSAFAGGERINRGAFHVTGASLRGAQISHNPGVNPTRGSAFGAANLGHRVSTPPRSVENRAVMARTAPAAGASHMPVQRLNTRNLSPGQTGNRPGNSMVNRGSFNAERPGNAAPRANQNPSRTFNNRTFNDRPPSARPNLNGAENGRANSQMRSNGPRSFEGQGNAARPADRPANSGANSQMRSNGTRTWAAQGNSTDHGQAPRGFGQDRPNISERSAGERSVGAQRNDRPPWAGSEQANGGRSSGRQPGMNSNEGNRGNFGGQGRAEAPPRSYSQQPRSYSPPSRTYAAPNRGYPAPSRSYSPPARSYSPPPRVNSAPSRSYSAPSRSYSGGGGGARSYGGGGGSRGGGGGSPHGGGGGGHPHR